MIVDGTLHSFAPAGLIEYEIPEGVTTIRGMAFDECSSLISVTIPNSVTQIGHWAFIYCNNLTSVTIGDSVATIEYGAFQNCSSLTTIYCKAITPPTAIYNDLGKTWLAFNENAPGRKIYVPMESVEAYKSAEYWCDYAEDIVGYDF